MASPTSSSRERFLGPLGLFAGFVDATGGGWGPVGTPALLAGGRIEPRKVIGSIDTSEFLVAVAASLGFLFSLGSQGIDWTWAAAILLGGVVAAPVAAYLVRHVPPRLPGSLVGGMIILTNTLSLLRSDWIAYSVHQYVTDKARESSDALHREFTEREAALVAVGGPGAAEDVPADVPTDVPAAVERDGRPTGR